MEHEGVPGDQASLISDTILYAHQTGKGTHGANRLMIYINKIRSGHMSAVTELKCLSDKGVVSCFDAAHGFGQVAAADAIKSAVSKAAVYGAGISAVRNSNNFGTLAYFANMAAEQNKIAVIFSNAAPAISPWGGTKPLFGTNPVAFGFPAPQNMPPIILDMAVAAAARGKIRQAARNGDTIPFDWALDAEGKPTNDPAMALLGSLIPIGGHKGAGLAMIVDLFAGLLTGSAYAGAVKPLNTLDSPSENGHFFLVIDPGFFMDSETYFKKVMVLIEVLKSGRYGENLVYPGERAGMKRMSDTGMVDIADNVWSEISQHYSDIHTTVTTQ